MKTINYKSLQLFLIIILFISVYTPSCKNDKKNNMGTITFSNPIEGSIFKLGDDVNIKLNFGDLKFDSVIYTVDSVKISTNKDTLPISFNTRSLTLGNKLITATIFNKGKKEEIVSNIVLFSSIVPANYSYKIVSTYAHDTSSYTEGLEFKNGYFYESDGEYGQSSLRKTAIDGKIIQSIPVEKKYFAEGITIIGDKIIQLTYREGVGFEYDKNTLKLIKTFPYNHTVEGWGLTHDEKYIYNSDGSNKIFLLDKSNYAMQRYFEVFDDKGPVTSLNELEYIDGKLYANIYGSDLIAIINPVNGEVEAYINLMNLPKGNVKDISNDVLNGIAYDSSSKRIYVTGKKWDKLFEIKLVKN